MVARLRADGVRTVVWVDAVGQPRLDRRPGPPDAESERLHRAARAELRAAPTGTSSATRTASRSSPAGGWARGSPVDFTSPAAEDWWREQAKRVLALGVEGIKADDGEGWYIPDDARFADGTAARARRGGYG